jgi:hypothetical protein
MINRFFDAMFARKYPKGYTGRHRAQLAFVRDITPALARGTSTRVGQEVTA